MKYKLAENKLPVLTQLCKLITSHLVSKLARKYGIDTQARTLTACGYVVSLLFAQGTLSHLMVLIEYIVTLLFTSNLHISTAIRNLSYEQYGLTELL